jgi:hypothetical protein
MKLDICDEPIFVIGAPRSGTSMMQWALRQHPELWGGQESDYLVPLIDDLRREYDAGSRRGRLHWLSGQGVSWDEFLQHAGYGINSLYMSRSNGRRWVEQTPQYTHNLVDLATMFPGSMYLFMLRDGRAVVSSLRMFVNPVPHHEACRIWKESVQAGLDFGRSPLGDRLLMVSYERVVDETEAEIRRMYDFLNLSYEPKSAEFIERKSPINSSFRGEVSAQKVLPRWATWSEEERAVFQEMAGHLLVELGYETDDSWVTASLTEEAAT